MTADREPPASEGAPPTPRWVKAFGVVIVILVLAFIVMHLTGNSLANHR